MLHCIKDCVHDSLRALELFRLQKGEDFSGGRLGRAMRTSKIIAVYLRGGVAVGECSGFCGASEDGGCLARQVDVHICEGLHPLRCVRRNRCVPLRSHNDPSRHTLHPSSFYFIVVRQLFSALNKEDSENLLLAEMHFSSVG